VEVALRVWADENPYYLGIAFGDGAAGITIDLGQQGWATTYAEYMRSPGVWALMRKDNHQPVLVLVVHPGEQPYYTARHVGIAGSGGSNEIVAYGIGKKRLDGQTDRIWVLPNGAVCGGEDVGDLGVMFVKALGPK
jgi:hypothetical protein